MIKILDELAGYINKLDNECEWFYNFNREFFEKEIKKEMNSDHFLYNKKLKAILKSECNDDVIYYIEDKVFVVVHLTYQKESTPFYPRYEIIENIIELKKYITYNI